MQSILIFIVDLQMAKRQFVEKFESSDDYRVSPEHNQDALLKRLGLLRFIHWRTRVKRIS
jgi:hypothetical protein